MHTKKRNHHGFRSVVESVFIICFFGYPSYCCSSFIKESSLPIFFAGQRRQRKEKLEDNYKTKTSGVGLCWAELVA